MSAVAVVGEALMDAHVDGDMLRLSPGGGPFNTAVTLGFLGVPVAYFGALSCDRFGRQLEETLSSAGVDTAGCPRVLAPTPIAIVDVAEGRPSYAFHLAHTSHDALGSRDLPELNRAVAAVHVGTLALATDPPASIVAEFAEREASRRVLMVDPNVRPAVIDDVDAYVRRFEQLAEVADLVKLSDEDLAWIYPDAAATAAVERLLGLGAGCVVVTHGADGAEAWTDTRRARVAAPAVEVVDTVGAGDACGAGLLAWLWHAGRLDKASVRRLRDDELVAALSYAVATASSQCMRASAWGTTRADVEQLLEGMASPTSRNLGEGSWQRSSSIR